MSKEPATVSKIDHSARGIVHLPLGGKDHTLRFRTHELCLLEDRLGRGILGVLNEQNIGISFLKEAIIVGVAHEYISAKGKKGLTESMVEKWIDNCFDKDGISFADLLQATVKAVVGGMPDGDSYMNEDEDEDGDEGDDSPPAPAPDKGAQSKKSTGVKPS